MPPFANCFSLPRKIFCAIVMPDTVPCSCTIMPMPAFAPSIIVAGAWGFPSKNISPLVAGCMPAAMEVIVDFPEPFSPISPVISPRYTLKSTPLSATVGPKCLVKFLASKSNSFSFPLYFHLIYIQTFLLRSYIYHTSHTSCFRPKIHKIWCLI